MLLGTTSRLPLVALAVLIGAAVVIIGNVAISLALRHPLIDDGSFGSIDAPDVALLQFFDAGLPLLLLAFRNVRRRRFWLTAIILTAAFWSYFLAHIWQDSLTGFAGGANIGLGLIMLASPFVTIACLGILRLLSGLEDGKHPGIPGARPSSDE
jgi:uncharacterized membrane-anchored protein YitT (DUF2179 family)